MNLNHVTIMVTDLERSAAYYRALGLAMIVHAPPRYARFTVPDGRSTFSIEVTKDACSMRPERCHIYFECDDLDERCAALAAGGVEFLQPPTDMPYLWREAWLRDPDGHDIRFYRAGVNRLCPPWRIQSADALRPASPPLSGRRAAISYVRFEGPREQLRHLFELADDSSDAINRYLDDGEIIAADEDGVIIGYAQLVDRPDALEIRSLAVVPWLQGRGIGTRLIDEALDRARERAFVRVTLFTSVAAFDSLGFYFRRGFRVRSIARDVFTEAGGYPPNAQINRIPLNDAVELELPVPERERALEQ